MLKQSFVVFWYTFHTRTKHRHDDHNNYIQEMSLSHLYSNMLSSHGNVVSLSLCYGLMLKVWKNEAFFVCDVIWKFEMTTATSHCSLFWYGTMIFEYVIAGKSLVFNVRMIFMGNIWGRMWENNIGEKN